MLLVDEVGVARRVQVEVHERRRYEEVRGLMVRVEVQWRREQHDCWTEQTHHCLQVSSDCCTIVGGPRVQSICIGDRPGAGRRVEPACAGLPGGLPDAQGSRVGVAEKRQAIGCQSQRCGTFDRFRTTQFAQCLVLAGCQCRNFLQRPVGDLVVVSIGEVHHMDLCTRLNGVEDGAGSGNALVVRMGSDDKHRVG